MAEIRARVRCGTMIADGMNICRLVDLVFTPIVGVLEGIDLFRSTCDLLLRNISEQDTKKNNDNVQMPTSLKSLDSTSDKHCSMVMSTVPGGISSLSASLRRRNCDRTFELRADRQ